MISFENLRAWYINTHSSNTKSKIVNVMTAHMSMDSDYTILGSIASSPSASPVFNMESPYGHFPSENTSEAIH